MQDSILKETKIEYLMGYEKALRQMIRMRENIGELYLDRHPSSARLTGMPSGHNKKDLSDYEALLESEKMKYIQSRYERIKICKEIIACIETLDDEDEKDILTLHYIRRKNWQYIAFKMGISVQHVHKIHNKALENLKIFENAIECDGQM